MDAGDGGINTSLEALLEIMFKNFLILQDECCGNELV